MSVNTQNIEVSTILELAVAKYNELLESNTVENLVEMLHDKEHELTNIKEHTLIVESLKENRSVYTKLVILAIKHIIISSVKELPLLVLVNILAETLVGRKAHNRIRIASTLVKLLQNTELFTIMNKINSLGHKERIVILKYTVSTVAKTELLAKTRNLPTSTPVKPTHRFAGHSKKVALDNSHMDDVLRHLNEVAYTLDARVWEKYGARLAAYRFDDIPTQEAMLTEGDKLVGTTFYFGHQFGIDNGRVYCNGDLFTLQGGALNYAFKFADKRVLSETGLAHLKAKVQELSEEATLSFKEEVEFYSLSLDLIDAEAGRPVGTILHIDAKLSGLQHQCIATRTYSEAVYCGLLDHLEDGYGHLRNSLSNKDSLSRKMVKDGYNPYQYGAGKATVEKAVRDAGGVIDYTEWETAYEAAFPQAFALRAFLLSLSKHYASDTFSYVTPSGFNAVITALGTETDHIVTCYGKLEYKRKEIDKKHMGVKLVAAFSHMMDASAVHYIVRGADFDISVVHDSFGVHPNDIDTVHTLYVSALREHLAMPILREFTASIIGERLAEVNVARLMSNTLTPSDIVAGLY